MSSLLSTWWINKIEGKIPTASFDCSVSHLINCNQIYVDEACLIDEFAIYLFAHSNFVIVCGRWWKWITQAKVEKARSTKVNGNGKFSFENNSIRFGSYARSVVVYTNTTAVWEIQVASSNRDFHGTVNTSTLILLIFY